MNNSDSTETIPTETADRNSKDALTKLYRKTDASTGTKSARERAP